jgi:hypothetical protein
LVRSFAASIAAISGGKPDALFLSRREQTFSLVVGGCECHLLPLIEDEGHLRVEPARGNNHTAVRLGW